MVSAARFHCETLSAIMRVNRRLAQLRIAGDLALHALPSASPSSAQRVVCTDLEIGLVIASQRFGTSRQQAYLGHKNIRHTVRYTELSPDRFKDFWRADTYRAPPRTSRLFPR
jgi:type 1 fimbriae regulatory protein FimB/type 1 fimbriae regulatory protein FimE